MFLNRFCLILLIFPILLFSQELKKVNLQLQWKHQFEFAGFYAAKEKGFYKDIGLEVSFLEFNVNDNIIDKVLNKEANFGLTYSSLIAEYLNNKPITFVANYFKQSPLVLVTQKDIKRISQLRGKKIMGVSDDIDSITLKLLLEKFNISLDEITKVEASFNITDFKNKNVDAMAVFSTNEIFQLNEQEIEFNLYNPSIYMYEYYDLNLFTSKEFALKNKQMVKDFREASNKGWKYALENKDEIVELILQKYNSQNKTKEALIFEANQIEQLMLSTVEEIGSIDPKRVELIAKSFIEAGFASKPTFKNIDKLIFDKLETPYLSKLPLSPEEKVYLTYKKSISMCVNPKWEPFEKIENGKYIGLTSDFMKLIENRIGKKLKVVPTKTWEESLEFIKTGKCEIISFLDSSKERKKYLDFTPVLYEEDDVIIAKDQVPYLEGIKSLYGRKVGLIKGNRIEEFIRKNHPRINIVHVKSNEEAMKLISNGDIFASINSLTGSIHLIKNLHLINLKIAGKANTSIKYRMGINKSDNILKDILSKAVNSISENEKDKVFSNWLSIKYTQGTDYDLLIKTSLIFLFIISILFYRHFDIKRINARLEKEKNKQLKELVEKDRMIFHQNKLISMGEMLENIAHQWRQPLTQINSAILVLDNELHKKNIKSPSVDEKLDEIETLTKYMSDTINDFRGVYSKNQEKEEFDISKSIENVINIIKGPFDASQIQISLETPSKLKPYNGLKNELEQSLLIILNNAKDALKINNTPNACVSISIIKKSLKYIIKITDNAGGINEKIKEKIFEPYFTTKHQSQGTGLGLYIARKIITDRLNGKIYCQNEKNGVSFYIELDETSDIS